MSKRNAEASKTITPKEQTARGSVDRPVGGSFANCAWVHRRGKPTWLFRPDPVHRALSHKTRSGTVYLIMVGVVIGKPFWIGRVHHNIVFTVEKEIRARDIEFSNGGRYIFPNVEVTGDPLKAARGAGMFVI